MVLISGGGVGTFSSEDMMALLIVESKNVQEYGGNDGDWQSW